MILPPIVFIIVSISNVDSCNFRQTIEIDTSKRMLQITPDYNNQTAIEAHRDIEKRLENGRYDLINDLYMLFRYRDEDMISQWLKMIIENPEHELLQLWFINAVEQIGNKKYLKLLRSFKESKNAIIREYVANCYGFLGTTESIAELRPWYDKEENGYVKTTISAAITAIENGGYKSKIPYLPKYYPEKPLKIQFLFNKSINNDQEYQFDLVDTSGKLIDCLSFCYPHQQYLWRLKNAPKRGFFGSKTKSIFHIGNDSGWLLEGLPVHAVCDGIVKQISHNLSWGTLVVIESRNSATSDTLCTIYGHLSPFLDINTGKIVKKGDKIGQIGNSTSYDNGGYWAHLHFGIEKKSFWRAQIVGYDQDTSSYENPVRFIGAHENVR